MKLNLIIILIYCIISAISFENNILPGLNTILNLGRQEVLNIIDISGVKTKCASDLRALVTDVFQRKLWALKMLDANGKVQPGLFMGNLYQLGNFDQCISISENRSGSEIKGQYCGVPLFLRPNVSSQFANYLEVSAVASMLELKGAAQVPDIMNNIKFIYGVCMPLSCSIDNLQAIWNAAEAAIGSPLHALFNDVLCTYDGKPYEPYEVDVYVYFFFLIVAAFVGCATIYDVHIANNDREHSVIVAFSLYSNAKKLFSTTVDENRLTSVNGLKVICMFWIILGHRFLVNIYNSNINAFYFFEWEGHLGSTIILSAAMAVDTFFALSGLLLAFAYLRHTEDGRKLPLTSFYIYRFARLNIPLGAMILFYVSIFKNLTNGTTWPVIVWKCTTSCYRYGWATFLHISNFLPIEKQCIEQAWYLAVDTQLYLMSPIILKFLRDHPRKTISGTVVAAVLSMAYAFTATLKHNYGAVFSEANKDFYEHIYHSTFVRMPTWAIGVIFGYLIYQTRSKNVHIPKMVNMVLWTLCWCGLVGIILGHAAFIHEYNALRSATFNSLARPTWALCVCWIAFACTNGHGGMVNRFLSLPLFAVLAKLTYSMFLTHMMLILIVNGSQKHTDEFSNLNSYHQFWGDLAMTLTSAAVLSLIFESPMFALGKMFGKKYYTNGVKRKSTTTDGRHVCVFPIIESREKFE